MSKPPEEMLREIRSLPKWFRKLWARRMDEEVLKWVAGSVDEPAGPQGAGHPDNRR